MKRFTLILLLLALTSIGTVQAQTSTLYGGTGRRGLDPYGILTGGVGGNNPVLQIAQGDSLKFLQSMGPGLLPVWVTAGAIATPVSIANGGTNATTAAAGIKNLLPDTTSNSSKVLTVVAGGGISWASTIPTTLTVRSITAAATIASADQLAEVTVDGTYDITLPLANSVAAGHGVWIMDDFAMDGTQSGTRHILPSGSDHLIIHQSIITSQTIASNQFQSGLWISDGVSRWYCVSYVTSAL